MSFVHVAVAARHREGGSVRSPNVVALTLLFAPILAGLLPTVLLTQPVWAILGLIAATG